PSEAYDDVLGEMPVDFHEFTVVHHLCDYLLHIVGLVGTVGHYPGKAFFQPVGIIGNDQYLRIGQVVVGNIADKPSDLFYALFFVCAPEMRDTALRVMYLRTSQGL